jgi:hypothetical protein
LKRKNNTNWKEKYHLSRKRERKINFIKTGIGLLVSLLLFYIVSLVWNDEARFFGRKVDVKKGVITNTEFKQRGRAGYYQKVDYQIIHKGEIYETYFWANKRIGQKYKGDSIYIKFEVNNPNNSKYFSK